MNSSQHNKLMFKMVALIYVIHTLIAFVTYKILAAYVNDNKDIAYIKAANLPLPSQGEALFLYSFMGTLILSIVVTVVLTNIFNKKFTTKAKIGVREFVLLNIIPIVILLICVYQFFDPLVSVAAYLALFTTLIYFRDY